MCRRKYLIVCQADKKLGYFLLQNYGGDAKSKIIHFAAVNVHVPEATYLLLACFWALKQHLY